jgi:hypothetical protein
MSDADKSRIAAEYTVSTFTRLNPVPPGVDNTRWWYKVLELALTPVYPFAKLRKDDNA